MRDRTRTKADPALIAPGTIFDTPYESGCVALSAPDEQGNFDAVADLTRVINLLDGYGLVVTDDSLVEERIRDLIGAE